MLRAVIALCVVLALGSSAEAKRLALVIGNSAYVHAGTLANSKDDATDVAAALRKSRFGEAKIAKAAGCGPLF